ncbi:MAG: hypothetical protein JXB39_13845 [Deltaproteobacteria bacterium]|nr:hypothetical protein [Deltaproteobacteria bacterium]
MARLHRLLVPALAALLVPRHATAQSMAMEPMNRLHAGGVVMQGPAGMGLSLGFDSRLTRLIFVDAGGFVSPVSLPAEAWDGQGDAVDALRLRHGITLSPGLRVPHAQPAAFSYDVVIRMGAAAAWVSDLSDPVDDVGPPYTTTALAAGFAGADLSVLRGPIGLRLGYRQFLFVPFVLEELSDVMATRPMGHLEVVWQFGGAR